MLLVFYVPVVDSAAFFTATFWGNNTRAHDSIKLHKLKKMVVGCSGDFSGGLFSAGDKLHTLYIIQWWNKKVCLLSSLFSSKKPIWGHSCPKTQHGSYFFFLKVTSTRCCSSSVIQSWQTEEAQPYMCLHTLNWHCWISWFMTAMLVRVVSSTCRLALTHTAHLVSVATCHLHIMAYQLEFPMPSLYVLHDTNVQWRCTPGFKGICDFFCSAK